MKLIGAGLSLVLFFGGIVLFTSIGERRQISSFAECVEAGNTVSQSYPPVCTTSDGRSFVEITGGTSPTPAIGTGRCGIENCHGLDIVCGENAPEICTMIYQLGDFCREFASCQIIEGDCQLVENPAFTTCKNCVEKCIDQYGDDGNQAYQCENECRKLFD